MKHLNRWICWLKNVWGGFPFDYYISGHSFVEQTDGKLKCEVCDYVSV